MSNEWITDRLPTEADADDTYGYVWITEDDGRVLYMMWDCVTYEPWLPFKRPAPYVKPKRYEVFELTTERFCVGEASQRAFKAEVRGYVAKYIPTREAAERIAAIYEEMV